MPLSCVMLRLTHPLIRETLTGLCRRDLLKVLNINAKSSKFAWSKETLTVNYLSFYLELNAALIRYAEVNTSTHS